MLKRADIQPGVKLMTVKPLSLDTYRLAWGEDQVLAAGYMLEVLEGPRKIERINLVRVKIEHHFGEHTEHEVFYCDILKHCQLAPGTEPEPEPVERPSAWERLL